jgi:4'-phosphopantetheinyl transferase EntD
MIEALMPEAVHCAESFGEITTDPDTALFPEEAAAVANAVAKRRREFADVRAAARRALAELGYPAAPILPGERGAPGWPAGVAGSMTHCDGYRGAVVARDTRFASLGVDAEPCLPLPEGVLQMISLPEEREALARLAGRGLAVHGDRLLFCAKEAVYKAWFPLTRQWLEFEEAQVDLRADGGFSARLLVPGPVVDGTRIEGFEGRWLAERGLLIAAIAVPRPGPAAS